MPVGDVTEKARLSSYPDWIAQTRHVVYPALPIPHLLGPRGRVRSSTMDGKGGGKANRFLG